MWTIKRVHLGLSKVAFIEGCPHVRGGLYRGVFHCIIMVQLDLKATPHINGGHSLYSTTVDHHYSLGSAFVQISECFGSGLGF